MNRLFNKVFGGLFSVTSATKIEGLGLKLSSMATGNAKVRRLSRPTYAPRRTVIKSRALKYGR